MNPGNIAVEIKEFVLHGNTQKATGYYYTMHMYKHK